MISGFCILIQSLEVFFVTSAVGRICAQMSINTSDIESLQREFTASPSHYSPTGISLIKKNNYFKQHIFMCRICSANVETEVLQKDKDRAGVLC